MLENEIPKKKRNFIWENRLTAKGYGEKQPVAINDTASGRAQNRRTEVRVIKR